MEETPLHPAGRPVIHVTLIRDGIAELTLKFQDRFRIGSDSECDVVLADTDVSPVHAEVWFEKGTWRLKDLSHKGETFINGQPIDIVELEGETQVLFGMGGQVLVLDVRESVHHEIKREERQAFKATGYVPVSEFRMASHRLLRRFLREQTRKYGKIIAALILVAVLAAGYAYLKHRQVEKQEALAQDVFYRMKEFELTLVRLEAISTDRGDSLGQSEIARSRATLKELSDSYDRYVGQLGVYSEKMDDADKEIYRVARIFGECELTMPKGFADEVKRYINEWKLSNRLSKSIERARAFGYTTRITDALLAQHLPPQFFFLALQESGFDSSICGPPTRFGIAKGMWQFIPSTATAYGLRTGPLLELPRLDPRDERHRVDKANVAAARYIRDIYSGEAQASGLLVLASYNWGHNVVRHLIQDLPKNPRERNFWKFLAAYRDKIPKQTYEYVFFIFSAAVICENPALFGFSFERPLPSTEQ
jgi:membrane-bound lytic murein transglycosylase D